MPGRIKIGRVFGIPVRVDWTWFIALLVIGGGLGSQFARVEGPLGARREVYWLMGLTTALLLFASVLAHELSHALVAQSRGVTCGLDLVRDVGGGDRTVQAARLPHLRGEAQVQVADPLAEVRHLGTDLVLAALFGALQVVDLLDGAGCRQDRQVLRDQVVPSVARCDVAHIAYLPEFRHVVGQYHSHDVLLFSSLNATMIA